MSTVSFLIYFSISLSFFLACLSFWVFKRLTSLILPIISVSRFFFFLLTLLTYTSGESLFQNEFKVPWLSTIGSSFSFGFDSLNLLFLVVISGLFSVLMLESIRTKNIQEIVLISLHEVFVLLVLLATDFLCFYVFWELLLIPLYFLLGLYNKNNEPNSKKYFLLYTLAGSVGLLCGILYIYSLAQVEVSSGMLSFSTVKNIESIASSPKIQSIIILLFLASFLVKIPLFPFHSWLPRIINNGRTSTNFIFLTILYSLGMYGVVRFGLFFFPYGWKSVAYPVAVFSTLAVVYGAFAAFGQSKIRSIIAYSSIGHLGIILIGLASTTTNGLVGSLFHIISHSISVAGIVIVLSMLENRSIFSIDNPTSSKLEALAIRAPRAAVVLFVLILGYIAVPLTNGFIGEFLIIVGAVKTFKVLAFICAFGAVFGAVYMLRMYGKVFLLGTSDTDKNKLDIITTGQKIDLNFTELVSVTPFIVLTVLLGVYPSFIINHTNVIIKELFSQKNGAVISEHDSQNNMFLIDDSTTKKKSSLI
jgi:NADH-quinone oxidoreductase subunit M